MLLGDVSVWYWWGCSLVHNTIEDTSTQDGTTGIGNNYTVSELWYGYQGMVIHMLYILYMYLSALVGGSRWLLAGGSYMHTVQIAAGTPLQPLQQYGCPIYDVSFGQAVLVPTAGVCRVCRFIFRNCAFSY